MSKEIQIFDKVDIISKIFNIRDVQVMFDRDLAELYGVETRVLNQAVKRNLNRFPIEFTFQLTEDDLKDWMSQIVISNKEKMGIRKMPFVFTEQGVIMLASVLRSETAVQISIQIVKSFIQMRKFIANNAVIFQRMERIEHKLLITDEKLERVFEAIEAKEIKPKQGIFYDGQIFDAYIFVSDLIKKAKESIIIIDNYVDESVLNLLTKRNKSCSAVIYTKKITDKLKLDLVKHNKQYSEIIIKEFIKSHDRFLIIDNIEIYHFGASLKDLGNKIFAFSKLDKVNLKILELLNC
jgi:phage regulator Rha-like protein